MDSSILSGDKSHFTNSRVNAAKPIPLHICWPLEPLGQTRSGVMLRGEEKVDGRITGTNASIVKLTGGGGDVNTHSYNATRNTKYLQSFERQT